MEDATSLRAWLVALVVAAVLLALQVAVWAPLLFGTVALVVHWESRVARYGALSALAGLVGLPMVAGVVLWTWQACTHTVASDALWALPVSIGTMSMRYWAAGVVPITVSSFWWGGAVAGWVVETRRRRG